MKLVHNANGKEITMPKADFEKFSKDQQKTYSIIDASDANDVTEEKKIVTSNVATEKSEGKVKVEPAKS